jgi:hypothetical protein
MYSDILKFDVDAATTAPADIMAALAAHFDAAPGHWAVDHVGTGNARVLVPKTPPPGYDQQGVLRLDGSNNLCASVDPNKGYTTGGSIASPPSGGSILESPELSTSIASGIGSVRIGVWEDLESIKIMLHATSKTHQVRCLHFGRTWAPLRSNHTTALGMMGFGVHVGIPAFGIINNIQSGQILGDGGAPVGSVILINGVWYRAAQAFNHAGQNASIANGVDPDLIPVQPIPISAANVRSSTPLYCGHMIHFGYIPINDTSGQSPRATRDAAPDEAWMYFNNSFTNSNQVTSHQFNAPPP